MSEQQRTEFNKQDTELKNLLEKGPLKDATLLPDWYDKLFKHLSHDPKVSSSENEARFRERTSLISALRGLVEGHRYEEYHRYVSGLGKRLSEITGESSYLPSKEVIAQIQNDRRVISDHLHDEAFTKDKGRAALALERWNEIQMKQAPIASLLSAINDYKQSGYTTKLASPSADTLATAEAHGKEAAKNELSPEKVAIWTKMIERLSVYYTKENIETRALAIVVARYVEYYRSTGTNVPDDFFGGSVTRETAKHATVEPFVGPALENYYKEYLRASTDPIGYIEEVARNTDFVNSNPHLFPEVDLQPVFESLAEVDIAMAHQLYMMMSSRDLRVKFNKGLGKTVGDFSEYIAIFKDMPGAIWETSYGAGLGGNTPSAVWKSFLEVSKTNRAAQETHAGLKVLKRVAEIATTSFSASLLDVVGNKDAANILRQDLSEDEWVQFCAQHLDWETITDFIEAIPAEQKGELIGSLINELVLIIASGVASTSATSAVARNMQQFRSKLERQLHTTATQLTTRTKDRTKGGDNTLELPIYPVYRPGGKLAKQRGSVDFFTPKTPIDRTLPQWIRAGEEVRVQKVFENRRYTADSFEMDKKFMTVPHAVQIRTGPSAGVNVLIEPLDGGEFLVTFLRAGQPPHIGFLQQHTLSLDKLGKINLTVGRNGGNDIVLPAQTVSAHHGTLEVSIFTGTPRVVFRDTGSTNGYAMNAFRAKSSSAQRPRDAVPSSTPNVFPDVQWLNRMGFNKPGNHFEVSNTPRGTSAFATHKGVEPRKLNEDAMYVGASGMTIADGMGGGPNGQEASKFLVNAIKEHPNGDIKDIVHHAHNQIQARYPTAGTTFVHSKINGNTLDVAWAGDSRCIVIGKDGNVKFISKDDGKINNLYPNGQEDLSLDGRNIITNVIGATDHLTIHTAQVPLSPGDIVIMGTDGLFDNLNSQDVVDFVYPLLTTQNQQPADVLQALYNGVLRSMNTNQPLSAQAKKAKRDNISAGIFVYKG